MSKELENTSEKTNRGKRKKKWKIGTALIVLLTLGINFIFPLNQKRDESIKKEIQVEIKKNSNDIPDGVRNDINKLDLLVTPDIQLFEQVGDKDNVIKGTNGTLILIPKGALLTENGEEATGNIQFYLIEALHLSDMLLYNLTTTSNGSLLESGGMIYLKAYQGESVLKINPEVPLYIEIPTVKSFEGMMTFEGEVDSVKKMVNWKNPKPLKKLLAKVPLKELDFLPDGFADRVKENFREEEKIRFTTTFIDSIYYELEHPPLNPIVPVKFRQDFLEDSLNTKEKEELSCRIRPSIIHQLKSRKYQNTFIATYEFEKRLRIIHQLQNGEKVLSLYLNHLKEDLSDVDHLVLQFVSNHFKAKFKEFMAEKATNVNEFPVHEKLLSNSLRKERREWKQQQNVDWTYKAKNERTIKWKKEGNISLRKVRSEMKTPPTISVKSYGTTWYSTGWLNIDKYLKDLGTSPVKVTIEIEKKNIPEKAKGYCYQWLNTLNTLTPLRITEGKSVAYFPQNRLKSKATTYTCGIYKYKEEYYWGIIDYQVKENASVKLSFKKTGLEKIKKELESLDPSNIEALKFLEKDELSRRKYLNRKYFLQLQSSKKWHLNVEETKLLFTKKLQRNRVLHKSLQKEQYSRMKDLYEFLSPCYFSKISLTTNDRYPSEVNYMILTMKARKAGATEKTIPHLSERYRFPEEARINNINDTVKLTFDVLKNGECVHAKIIGDTIGFGIEQSVIDLFEALPYWVPARDYKGDIMRSTILYSFPVPYPKLKKND